MSRGGARSEGLDRPRLFAVIGLIAIVLVLVGGYISYNALSGLPFQSTYSVTVALPDADRLIPTDDVRIAGVRVGQVARVTAQPPRPGHVAYAVVGLRLD